MGIIEPVRQRRLQYEADMQQVLAILQEGTERARAVTGETLQLAKQAMQQQYFYFRT